MISRYLNENEVVPDAGSGGGREVYAGNDGSGGTMKRETWLWRGALSLMPIISAGVLAGSAWATYWDHSGYMSQYDYYSEVDYYGPHTWQIRLNRDLCGTKIDLLSGSGYYRVPIPGGCSNNDYTHPWNTGTYYAGECYNADGPRMWVNCRVDPDM